MPGKPWDQLSADEKIEELYREIQDIRGRSNINIEIGGRELKAIKDRLEKLEKKTGQPD
jgi:uncharacterized coiled-coil DUF342 family protein